MHATQKQRCIILKSVRNFAQLQQQQQQRHVAAASCHQLTTAATEQRKSTNITTTATLFSLLEKTAMSSISAITRSSLTTLTRQPFHFPQHQIRFYSKFTAATEPPTLGNRPLCEKRAHDLIFNLKDSEYEAIKIAMAKYEAQRMKEGFEGEFFSLFPFLGAATF